MSIANQLLILSQTKNNIKESINLKGVEVTDEAFAEYPDKIRQIPNGGGWYESNVILFLERNIRTAVIPEGITSIGFYAFANCDSLTSIVITDSVTAIYDSAFTNCSSLTDVNIPDSVTSIGDYVFEGCSALTNAIIGSGITSIGRGIFNSCPSLKSITVNATTPPTLGTHVFSSTHNCPIYVPDDSVLAYQTADNWIEYADRIKGISEKPQ